MSSRNDGELSVVVDSHDHDHGTTRSRGDADSEEDEGCGDRESFFQCMDKEEPSGVELADDAGEEFPSDEDGDGDAIRVSFATAVGDLLLEEQAELDLDEEEEEDMSRYDYGMWMSPEPMSIQERRRRLLQGMGLTSGKDLLRSRNARTRLPPVIPRDVPRRQPQPVPAPAVGDDAPSTASPAPTVAVTPPEIAKHQPNAVLMRCRSDSRLAVRGGAARKPPTFRRVYSLPHSLHGSPVHKALRAAARCPLPSAASKDEGIGNGNDTGGGFTIKNLDNGKEFVVSGQFNDPQSGAQLSIDEFERFIGYTPLVKQLLRRSQSQPVPAGAANGGAKTGKKKKTRWLKNIKLVASVAGLRNEKEKDGNGGSRSARMSAVTMSKSASANATMESPAAGSERLKVHHYGKSSKELTGLYMRQEVRAHEGSIWSIKFSPDGRFLASGGEDRVVRVWLVVDADASPSSVVQELSASLPPPPPLGDPGCGSVAPGLAAQLSKKVRRGKSSNHVLPDHVVVPESVFALAKQPACAFEGHLDDVLDLSWSKSQQLLSSSMDKTVRLWDMDTQTCLKLFAHNDYVTCVQFNPVDDGYFISGSLDSKVRIWNVLDRQVVDWSDLSDMVTAACYTPDGQAAIIGSHKGSCRFYKTTGCKLNQEAQIDMSISKKRKSQAKKITGFQFAPGNPSEILVTSADSQIRVFNGITVLQKFKGFKNTSSQISASYTADGRYVVCASEDSHVYVWQRGGAPGGPGGGGAGGGIGVRAKTWLTSRSYEYFFCRDVSAAVPWPGSPSSVRGGDASSRRGKSDGASTTMPKEQGSSRSAADAGSGIPRRPKSGPMTYPGGQLPADLSRREPSARWHGGAEGGNAWGMVVVTASRGGEIRVYQNFGLPLGIRGQRNLFH
ncbi:uncharacterized protein LOC133900261 [Phragmites australis]|uniref:uncharacterized protein LOC133900261 n=1 Tax=Phragmites australis TaxID=29695 RepID=UPI002D769AB7|nr:uncharacterized protein LOC133900261 [Phragmites australis]